MKPINSKKGATRPALVIGYAILIIVMGVFFYTVYQEIAQAAAIAHQDTTSNELGLIIDVSYAAPGDIDISYETPQTLDGLPAVGSLLVNGDANKIKVHPYSEDEMYYHISNNALTAWGVGTALKAGSKVKKSLKERAVRKAKGQAAELVYDMNAKQYDEMLYAQLGPWQSNSYSDMLKNKKSGPALKAIMSDRQSIYLMESISKNDDVMKILRSDPKAGELLVKIAEAPGHHRQFIIAGNKKYLGGDAGVNYLTDKKGIGFLDTLKEDGITSDFIKQSSTVDDVDTFTDVVKGFGDTDVKTFFMVVADDMEASELVRKLGTSEGDEVLQMLYGGKSRKKVGRAYTRESIGHDFQAILGDQGKADEFYDFWKSADGDNFRMMLQKSGRRDYAKLIKEIDNTKDMKPAKRLAKLQKNSKVKKAIARGGLNLDDGLQSIIKFTDSNPKLAADLASKGSYRARYALSEAKHADTFGGLVQVAAKSDDAADVLKSQKGVKKLMQSMTAWRPGKAMSEPVKGAGRFLVKHVAVAGWAKNAGTAVKEGGAVFGEWLAKTALGVGFKTGVGSGTTIFALEPCAKNPSGDLASLTSKIICYGTQVLTIGALFTLDFIFVTYPMIMMTTEGYRTSSEMKAMDSDYNYIGDTDVIFADPPNCKSEVSDREWAKNLWEDEKSHFREVKELFGDVYDKGAGNKDWSWYDYIPLSRVFRGVIKVLGLLGPLFGEIAHAFPGHECMNAQLDTPTVQHHTNIDGECINAGGSCPNPYISKTGISTAGKVAAVGGELGVLAACGGLSVPWPLWGVVCYLGYYGQLAYVFTEHPDSMVPLLTGCDIYPHDEWWYADFPVYIDVSKQYNDQTGQQEVSIYAT
tara:strand:+ start:2629 stop:5220 length:2592 start_codon:yes stop_codon:yes gene_type:complete